MALCRSVICVINQESLKISLKRQNTGNIQILWDLVILHDNSSKKILFQAEHTESYT